MIGAAKELIEATAKLVLIELNLPVPPNADIGALTKLCLTELRLRPELVAPTTKGAEAMIRVLGGLTQIANGLAELRNLGYGTGHGQGRRIGGIGTRHAELAARAAIAYASFVLDTFADPSAPWRRTGRVQEP